MNAVLRLLRSKLACRLPRPIGTCKHHGKQLRSHFEHQIHSKP